MPIIQLALSGKTLSEAELYDYGIYRIRQQIAPIQGITLPLPYGGKPRARDVRPHALTGVWWRCSVRLKVKARRRVEPSERES